MGGRSEGVGAGVKVGGRGEWGCLRARFEGVLGYPPLPS